MATNSILASLIVRIAGDTAQFKKSLTETQSQLTSFTNGISKLGAAVGVSFGAFAAVGVIKNAIGVIADFEHQMSVVKAITGATGKEFDALEKSALDLGASTRYTSKQVAELQTEYGRLGFSTSEILAATEATLDLATATGESLAKSADVAGSTVRGFGLSADETRRVVDVMAESFNKSALGLENFSEAMKYVAPIAAQAGISVEETTALLGTLADAGIRGSQAGTSLRKIISDIGDESGTLSERLKKLAAKGLTGAEAMSEVGRTAYASLLVLAKNTEKTDDLTKALQNAAGAGAEAAKIMGDDLTGDLVLLDSAYDGLILTFSEGSGVLRELVQSFTNVLNAATALARGQGAIGGFFKSMAEHLTAPMRALGFFAKKITDANKEVDDHGEKLRAIENTVKAAFDSGNIEAYIKALDQNIYKEEIIAAIRKRQAEEAAKKAQIDKDALTTPIGLIQALEDKLKDYEEKKKAAFSVKEVGEFNVKIQELREQLALLNATGSESGFLKNLNKAQESGQTPTITDPSKGTPENLFPTTLPVPDTAALKATLFDLDNVKAELDKKDEARNKQAIARQDALIAKQQEQADAASEYGSIIGNAFGEAASGQKSFVQAAKQATADLVKTLLARALAGIIASAATSGGPPPVAIALAAAGVAAISALFSKFANVSGGGGGGSLGSGASSSVSRMGSLQPRDQPIFADVEFTIQGNDLVGVLNSQDRRNNRLSG
jgi:hypothetical protein